MRYLFLLNPAAGKQDCTVQLIPQIRAAAARAGWSAADYTIHTTEYAGHARELARAAAQEAAQAGDSLRIWTAGGDGTFMEAMTGVQGFSNAAVGCLPYGSGNDFLRTYGTRAEFTDLDAQLAGGEVTIDLLETSLGLSATICAAGLDAQVAYGIPKFRRIPLCGGEVSYLLSIVEQLCGHIGRRVTFTIDDEELTVDCPEEYSGTVIELATKRKGTLTNMASNGDRTRLEFSIPSRGIIGLRSNMLTATAGEAIMTHRLKGFEPWVGEIEMRTNGSIISGETGTAYAYSIDKLQDRGRFFISPMEQVYAGQVIGEHTRQNDITVNVTKAKQLTNMRASGSDEKTSIAPPKIFSLEEALEYIQADEYVEVTPHSMRLRKILLHEVDRKRASK